MLGACAITTWMPWPAVVMVAPVATAIRHNPIDSLLRIVEGTSVASLIHHKFSLSQLLSYTHYSTGMRLHKETNRVVYRRELCHAYKVNMSRRIVLTSEPVARYEHKL